MNKKAVIVVMFVFVAVALAGCNLPTGLQMNSGDPMNQPEFNEEMPFEEHPEGMPEDADAMQHEEQPREEERHPEEPREEEMHEEEPQMVSAEVRFDSFTANPPEIMYGECTLLKWRVEGQVDFELNGYPIGNFDQLEVCPTETQPYVLTIKFDGQELTKEVMVSVIRNPVD